MSGEWAAAPWLGQVLQRVDFQADYDQDDRRVTVDRPDQANVVTSMMREPLRQFLAPDLTHRPVLDIDVPLVAIPSSTPGHWHLYIDKPMPWAAYKETAARPR